MSADTTPFSSEAWCERWSRSKDRIPLRRHVDGFPTRLSGFQGPGITWKQLFINNTLLTSRWSIVNRRLPGRKRRTSISKDESRHNEARIEYMHHENRERSHARGAYIRTVLSRVDQVSSSVCTSRHTDGEDRPACAFDVVQTDRREVETRWADSDPPLLNVDSKSVLKIVFTYSSNCPQNKFSTLTFFYSKKIFKVST